MTLPGSRSLPRSPWAAPLYGLLLSLLLAGSAGGHAAELTLQELLAAGIIAEETARTYAVNRHRLELALRGIVVSQPILERDASR